MKQENAKFTAKIFESVRALDDEDLYNTPPFYQEMHKIGLGRAQQEPPAHVSTDK